MTDFRRGLEHLINKHSKEQPSNTPDFILARFLDQCLTAFDNAVTRRETWYGRDVVSVRPPEAISKPDSKAYEALGWMFAEACKMSREGKNPFQADISEILERAGRELGLKKD